MLYQRSCKGNPRNREQSVTSKIDVLHDDQNIVVTDMIFKWGDIDRATFIESLGNYICIDGSVKLLNSCIEGIALHNNIALTVIQLNHDGYAKFVTSETKYLLLQNSKVKYHLTALERRTQLVERRSYGPLA